MEITVFIVEILRWRQMKACISTHTVFNFGSTARMLSVTSHAPEVRKIGAPEVLAGLNRAIWLYPSLLGTISKYEGTPSGDKLNGRG